MAKKKSTPQQDPANPKLRTISTDELNDLSMEVFHIKSLAEVIIERTEMTIDEQSDSFLTLIKEQANKIQDILNEMFKKDREMAHD